MRRATPRPPPGLNIVLRSEIKVTNNTILMLLLMVMMVLMMDYNQVPRTVDALQGVLTVIPLQLLSYHLAVLRC